MTDEKKRKLLKEAQDRLQKAIDDEGENRRMALDDLEFAFVEGKQWPAALKNERESDGRPCITTNKMPIFIDQIVGDQRQNRPGIKVIPVDSKSDPGVAEVLAGWIKHVQEVSKSDVAMDHGFEHAVACGYGALRVVTEYSGDDTFEQDARIKKVDNALSVYWGPHTEYDCSDAEYCFLISDVDRDEFEATYKDVTATSWNKGDSQFVEGWATKDTVRVAEYFVKEPKKKTLYLLEDGRTVEKVEEGQLAVKKREVNSYVVKWYLLTGNEVLEERTWMGRKYIPVIPIWGKEINVGGKRYIRGLIRNAKDPQRMLNYWNSVDTEMIALAPKSPYMATPAQITGHEAQWNVAHKKNFPYLLVNFDAKAPGWPKREAPPQASSAMTQKIVQADQDIRDTMGLQKASLGMQSNERSGAAIRERKQEGDTGTFAFIDNLARSIEHLGRVLVDLAPGILDTERIVRLGLEDGLHKYEGVNVTDPNTGKILNDISVGTYDVVVTVGPSFTTQRTEARQALSDLIQYFPASAPVIGDAYVKLLDVPGADKIAKRLRFLLPPEVRAMVEKEEAANTNGQGQPPPEQTSPALPPPPPPPSPLDIIKVKQEEAKLAEMNLKVQQEQARLEGLLLENQIKGLSGKDSIKQTINELLDEQSQAPTQTPASYDPALDLSPTITEQLNEEE